MINAPNSPNKQQARTAIKTVRGRIRLLMPLLVSALFLLVLAPATFAFSVISEPGEGAGENDTSTGLAVDYETGRLYVADRANNRVDVFDSTGAFEKAFGWGVDNGANKPETCTVATTCRKGLGGEENGEFSGKTAIWPGGPTAIAVDNSCFLHKPEPLTGAACAAYDPSDGDVYVVDQASQRVEKFDSEGGFILTIGGGVDKTVPGNLCTEESKHICGAGADGFGEGEFSSSAGIFVGVGPGGVVYVVDSLQPPLQGNPLQDSKSRLQKFEPSGGEITPEHVFVEEEFAAIAFAVNSAGDFYVAWGYNLIREYGPTGGPPIDEIEEPETLGEPGIGAALTVDSEDNLFAASFGSPDQVSVMELDPAGNPLSRFGYGSFLRVPLALAPYHSASGDIYASELMDEFIPFGGRVVHLELPKPGPLVFPEPCQASPLSNTTATLSARVNPEGKASTYHFEYVTDPVFQEDVAKLGAGHGFDDATRLPAHEGEDPSLTADFTLHPVSATAALVPETKYHCRVVATNSDGTATGEEGTFTSLPPVEIGPGWTSDVGAETATMNATVNPLGISTTGFFEYVDQATYESDVAELGATHGFDHAIKVPDAGEPIDFGEESGFKAGATTVSGLKVGTSYRYRLIAADSYFPAGFAGPTEVFRTYGAGEGPLPDSRAYELVSPAEKNGAEVAVPGSAGGLFNELGFIRIQAAAGSGEAVSYTSWTSFADAKGASGASQYLSKRTSSGWGTANLSPFGSAGESLAVPYRGFTPDLGFGALVTEDPPLTSEAQQGFQNLYLRDNSTGHIQALTIEMPQPEENEGFCTSYAGASADGSRAFFAGDGAMAGAPMGKGFSLYEWSAAGGLALVSVLPDGIPATPTRYTGFGAVGENCHMDQVVVHNAVSADGRTAFWSYGGEYEGTKQPLFARIDGKETIELDGKPTIKAGIGPFGQGTFKAATSDGSKAFFTAPGKLTVGATKGDLYRYDTVTHTLTDLIPGTVAPEIDGVIGASEDGTYAYFVAQGVLTGEETNAAGEKATQDLGRSNLYVWHEGQGLRFIATLGADESDWQSVPERLSARLTPDGRHLAFLSVETEALSGYNNTIFPAGPCHPVFYSSGLIGGPKCEEAYLYDAEANKLVCASCNPAGSRPAGPTQLPGWSNPYEGPRYLSDDGSRLYFESRDALTAADKNAKRDVYEFEQAGTGSCTTGNPGFDPATGGCHFLISSGKSEDESYLIDASADGRDVFFSTRQPLLGWDTNENYDVYDARENGGFPEPPEQQSACLDENCKAPAAGTSLFSPLASATFSGVGNLSPNITRPAVKPKPKSLTRARKLTKALKRCESDKLRKRRAACIKAARKHYGRSK